jgi:hypothetical protein
VQRLLSHTENAFAAWDMHATMARMSEDQQIVVPASFIALYLQRGRSKPTAPRHEIAARHEFCDDLAHMLVEQAQTKLWELGVTEADVLQRVLRGLRAEGSVVSEPEAVWVVTRLAELLNWPALLSNQGHSAQE